MVSAKESFDSINAENIELKAYINKSKEYIIQQQHEQEYFKRIKKKKKIKQKKNLKVKTSLKKKR